MHITRLIIEELRAIDRLELDLRNDMGDPRRRTILLGVNGAGKTSVLDALVHSFGTLAEKAHLGARMLSASDVRNVDLPSRKIKAALRCANIGLDVVLSDDELREIKLRPTAENRAGTLNFVVGEPLDLFSTDTIDAGDAAFEFYDHKEVERGALVGRVVNAVREATFRDTASHAIKHLHPAAIFLPADRGILEYRDDLTLKEILGFESCSESLSRNRTRFAPLAARLALAHNAPQSEDGRAIARMWKILAKYFGELPKPVGAEKAELRFRNKRGAVVPLTALSDGERAILLIFAELALRAPGPCIILIDELEQHLHPRWQREILAALLAMAPLAQFVITTQSPFLAACAPDDVIKLPGWDENGE